jgi:murein DD-endopeptidase MepM/ murein hydrolase activator NlpD
MCLDNIAKLPGPSPPLPRACFTELLIRVNDRIKKGIDRWMFLPGMLFDSPDKWWGKRGRRAAPHEGLDLCLYRDSIGRIQGLDNKTIIPVMYGGKIVAVVSDFIGKSVIVEHKDCDSESPGFCSIYAHTRPAADLQIGNIVKKGEVLATIAGSDRSKSGIRPHLHLSLALTNKYISYERFDWQTVGSRDMLTLLDPLAVFDRPYQVLQKLPNPLR